MKTLWRMEKILTMSHNVFKRRLQQRRQIASKCKKGLQSSHNWLIGHRDITVIMLKTTLRTVAVAVAVAVAITVAVAVAALTTPKPSHHYLSF